MIAELNRISFDDFINRYKIFSVIVNSFLALFFSSIRFINRLLSYKSGNIVVISLHRLGDTVFTIPAIKKLKKKFGNKIIIYCFPESVPIYQLVFDDLSYCPVEHKNFFFNERLASSSARKKLRKLKPEVIIDLTGAILSISLLIFIKSKKNFGMNRKEFKKMYDAFVPVRDVPHLIDMYLDVVMIFNTIDTNDSFKYFPIEFNIEGKILVHPFAGWKAKEWNFIKFIRLVINLGEHFKVCTILPLSKIPKDVIQELMEKKIEIVQTSSIEELIKQIKMCSIFISNDSGPLYIASLLGKPTFSIYGPTNSEFSLPFGEGHKMITQNIQCSPINNKQYCFTLAGLIGCPSFECMNQLNFEKTYNKIAGFIDKNCLYNYNGGKI